MSRRDSRYRSGDRAESLGVVLLQAFCAVASVPRTEDFGIVDAVATLLRREKNFVYAEDSFAVQFKSQSERQLVYEGDKLRALLDQELSLFVARVDLKHGAIQLFGMPAVLAHPNVSQVEKLIVRFDRSQSTQVEIGSVLKMSIGAPALSWSTVNLVDPEFESRAYRVLKSWLQLDRENRRNRQMQRQVQIRWETDEEPTAGATFVFGMSSDDAHQLSQCVPAIETIATRAIEDERAAQAVVALIDWMKQEGVDVDANGAMCSMFLLKMSEARLTRALDTTPEAEIAAGLSGIRATPTELEFWIHTKRRNSGINGRVYRGSANELRKLGFKIEEIYDESKRLVGWNIGIGEEWAAERACRVIDAAKEVLLMKT